MPIEKIAATIDGTDDVELSIAYELIGNAGRSWAITPGGRFSQDYPGVRELAVALADLGNRALIYDRPNTGESDVCFVDAAHTRATSENVARVLPNARLVEPPWEDTEWLDSKIGRRFVNWPRLAPILHDWANHTIR